MRCKKVRNSLLETWPQDVAEPVRTHLAACRECRDYARDLGLIRAGFKSLAQEPAPDPSWRFTERLLRRLDEAPSAGNLAEDFFERVGRRVIYAAGVLALTLLLVLALPSTGPLRSPTAADLYWGQSEVASMGNDLGFADESGDSMDVTPAATEKSGTGNKQ